ncbi:MAG: wyosine base formation [Acidimicrobiales bacterium]|nr:wyosine base formation [Acidimicrobiales bacterium]
MDSIVIHLAAQHAELAGLIDPLDASDFDRPSPCEGWNLGDVVLHLAQTDEMAVGSATGRFAEVLQALTDGLPEATSVDDGVDLMVRHERDASPAAIRDRWHAASAALIEALGGCGPSDRVPWVAGQLSARTLATTRLAETWIHTGDVADALGVTLPATDRLQPIARLAWRTLPYAFSLAGRELAGPVAFELRGPNGEAWDLRPEEPAVTTIRGPAAELCGVAARRLRPQDTQLEAVGPDGEAVLALIRTYA